VRENERGADKADEVGAWCASSKVNRKNAKTRLQDPLRNNTNNKKIPANCRHWPLSEKPKEDTKADTQLPMKPPSTLLSARSFSIVSKHAANAPRSRYVSKLISENMTSARTGVNHVAGGAEPAASSPL
jgi:hypothetical protein